MPSKIVRWAACLLLWPFSVYLNEPKWPEPRVAPSVRVVTNELNALTMGIHQRASEPTAAEPDSTDSMEESIRKIPICIVRTKPWAGDLGQSILYRLKRLASNRFVVGYFAYWSTERAWGDNNLTRWFLPAVAIDGFYSHLLFVLPGVQRLLYGPGDVEGVRVTYELDRKGQLVPKSLVADDDTHREVSLDMGQALDEIGRIVVYNDVWSHQLGGKGAAAKARAGASCQCFSMETLRPLTKRVVDDFRLGSTQSPRRAGPAWSDVP